MADLASTAVSRYPTTSETEFLGGFGRQAGFVTKTLKLVLTGQGSATNKITATALGFKRLFDCTNLFDATNGKIYRSAIDPVNNIILLAAIAGDVPADITTTAAYITVTGTY